MLSTSGGGVKIVGKAKKYPTIDILILTTIETQCAINYSVHYSQQ